MEFILNDGPSTGKSKGLKQISVELGLNFNHLKLNDLKNELKKLTALLLTYLSFDWDNKINDDPAYLMIWESLKKFSFRNNSLFSETLIQAQMPKPMHPTMILKDNNTIVLLLRNGQYPNSAMMDFYELYYKSLLPNSLMLFLSVNDFFALLSSTVRYCYCAMQSKLKEIFLPCGLHHRQWTDNKHSANDSNFHQIIHRPNH